MVTKIPQPLRAGDFVALINPAGMLPERFSKQHEYVIEHLEELGYAVQDYVISGQSGPKERVKALHAAFANDRVRAVLPLCGGSGIYEVLPLLDYGLLASKPKIVCGSSEMSAFAVSLFEQAGLITFVGPHLNFLNPKSSKRENLFTIRSFWNMLQWDWHGRSSMSRHDAYNCFVAPRSATTEPVVLRNVYRESTRIKKASWRDVAYLALDPEVVFSGRLLIASLGVFVRLSEIDMKPDISGKIIIVDTMDMAIGEIEVVLQKLQLHYRFGKAAGIIFSSFTERTDRKEPLFPELRDMERIKLFLQKAPAFLGGQKNLCYGFPVGHCVYKLTIPIGVDTTFNAGNSELSLNEIPYEQI